MKSLLAALFALAVCALPAHAERDNHSVTYQKKALDFAYYVPDKLKSKSNLTAIVLVPGLGGKGDGMIDQAWMDFADKTQRIIIAPSFVFEGDDAFQKGKSYQYPKVWSGPALNAVLKEFASVGYPIKSLYMMGFSAGAQFVGRYAFLYPQKVKKCAIIASGGNDKITKGVSVKFFYGIGSSDADNRQQFAKDFETQAKKKHISVTTKVYPGVGHTLTGEMQEDVRQFFK